MKKLSNIMFQKISRSITFILEVSSSKTVVVTLFINLTSYISLL